MSNDSSNSNDSNSSPVGRARLFSSRVKISEIPVVSGQIMIFDPVYIKANFDTAHDAKPGLNYAGACLTTAIDGCGEFGDPNGWCGAYAARLRRVTATTPSTPTLIVKAMSVGCMLSSVTFRMTWWSRRERVEAIQGSPAAGIGMVVTAGLLREGAKLPSEPQRVAVSRGICGWAQCRSPAFPSWVRSGAMERWDS